MDNVVMFMRDVLTNRVHGYLKSFDPDADGGRGIVTFTPWESEAKTFATSNEALEFWRQQSVRLPLRPDGKPNKPLTAFHAEILQKGTKPI